MREGPALPVHRGVVAEPRFLRRLEALLLTNRDGVIQDAKSGLPRTPMPRTRVNNAPMDVFTYVGWHNHLQGNDQKKSAVAEISNFPIPLEVLYLFVLVVSLLVASVSALILLNALDEGDRLQAWISAGATSWRPPWWPLCASGGCSERFLFAFPFDVLEIE